MVGSIVVREKESVCLRQGKKVIYLRCGRGILDKRVFFIGARGSILIQFDTPCKGPDEAEAKQRRGKRLEDADDDRFSLTLRC